ncbi:MAG: presenilin family intramembrane aspartyl protease [Candidatus Pacearchaeota archaeon]
MKHNTRITVLLIMMFLVTQLIGLLIISIYNKSENNLPFGLQPPETISQDFSIFSILIGFLIAIGLLYILTKINAEKFIRFWFFIVTALAIGIVFKAIFLLFNLKDIFIITSNLSFLFSKISIISIIAFIIGIFLAYFKIYNRNLLVHNFTELIIYPGIASVFIPILNEIGIIILLLAISMYDIWAVWKSQFMQKMAKYQIENLKFFTGFFVPYADKKQKLKIKNIKEKYKNKDSKFLEKKFRQAKIKISLAILGGGDIVFPIITAGVFYRLYNPFAALIIIFCATISLLGLFIFAKKGKFYPAMPFLTIGLYTGMIINWLIF